MSVLAALAVALVARAPELQPKTYTSPSGGWSLRVEPEERSGTKGAEYVLTGREREAWRRRHPFALWDAVVTDDGRVAGYAYTGKTSDNPVGGELRVVVLSPAGDVLLEEVHERETSRFMHQPADPIANGLFAQPELGRVVVRVVDEDINRQAEDWWAYEVASGKLLFRERPKVKLSAERQLRFLLAARPVPGTPLVLLHWWRMDYDRKPKEFGAVFHLVDADWKIVWSLDLRHDYEGGGDEDERERLRNEIWAGGATLESGQKRFELRLVAEGVRATFGVELADGAWKVSELERAPFAPAAKAPAELPTRKLTLLARVPLGTAPPPGADIRDIQAFGFDQRSRLRFVRSESDRGTVSVVLLDENGSVLRATTVSLPASEDPAEWYSLAGERWLAVSETYDEEPARLRLVSETDGSVRDLSGFSGQDVERAVSLGPDALVLLGTWSTRYTMRDGLVACDLAGKVLWTVEEDLQDETELFGAQDVTVTTEGRVVVLENVSKALKVYSSSGEFLRLVDLQRAWGREPNYPSSIRADRDGGVLVNDFEGEPPLWRMDRDFSVLASFDVRRADGSTLDEYRRFAQVAPDGRLWTSDRHEFLRLDESGRVDLELGPTERADVLEDPGFACVESLLGRVLVHDRRTRAVHVFDGEGRRVTLCRPEPDEREQLEYPMALAVAPDGSVCVADGQYDLRAVRFAASGESQGFQDMKAANIAFSPGGGNLGVNRDGVELIGPADELLARIDKRPDGQWFSFIEDLSLAADGSIAVLDIPQSGLVPKPGQASVSLYGPRGEPRCVHSVPAAVSAQEIAFQGGRVLLKNWANPWLMDAEGGAVVALTLGEPASAFGLSPDGSELWAVSDDRRTLLRYALEP